MKTALMIGATGLVGKSLLNLLLNDPDYECIKIFSRRSPGIQHPKLREHLIDFNQPDDWQNNVTGDVLFSCLGTTLKQAGSKDAQFKVDFTFQHNFAKIAAGHNVPKYVLISSAGANPTSVNFYSAMKGKLENAITKLPFFSISVIRPSLLTGNRETERSGEKIGYYMLRLFNTLGMFRKYAPVSGETVARTMIRCASDLTPGITILEPQSVSGSSA